MFFEARNRDHTSLRHTIRHHDALNFAMLGFHNRSVISGQLVRRQQEILFLRCLLTGCLLNYFCIFINVFILATSFLSRWSSDTFFTFPADKSNRSWRNFSFASLIIRVRSATGRVFSSWISFRLYYHEDLSRECLFWGWPKGVAYTCTKSWRNSRSRAKCFAKGWVCTHKNIGFVQKEKSVAGRRVGGANREIRSD